MGKARRGGAGFAGVRVTRCFIRSGTELRRKPQYSRTRGAPPGTATDSTILGILILALYRSPKPSICSTCPSINPLALQPAQYTCTRSPTLFAAPWQLTVLHALHRKTLLLEQYGHPR